MRKINIILCLICVFVLQTIQAQEDGYSIDLHYYNAGSYVALRWYPENFQQYQNGSKNGFIVQRREKGESNWNTLQNLSVAPYSEFESIGKENEKAFMVGFLSHYDEVMKRLETESDSIEPDNDDEASFDIKEYNRPESLDMLYGMSLVACEFNLSFAKMAALYYKDEQVVSGKTYEYRVVASNKVDDPKARIVSVDMNRLSSLPQPKELKLENEGKKIYLEWDITTLKDVYAGYIIERSEDGKNFYRINKEPIVHLFADEQYENLCSCKDTLPKCDKDYYYRFCGINNFGIEGPHSPSVQVRVECDYLVNVFIDTVAVNEKNEAEIQWSVTNPMKQKISGFTVQNISKLNGVDPFDIKAPFTTVHKSKLSAKNRSYKDSKTNLSNYYRVIAWGKDETEFAISNVYFAHQIDSVPPTPPTGLMGSIDSAGIVRIEWTPNPEPDIFAYRVFFANDSNEIFIGCSDTFLKSPSFVDTVFLGSLTNDIYYKVIALDNNYNQSEFSRVLKLEKPDTIPPAKAIFVYVGQDSLKNMQIRWENSPSTDLQKVELYRKLEGEGEWTMLKKWSADSLVEEFYDDYAFKGEYVSYQLITYDRSNNSTPSEMVPIKGKAKPIDAIANLKLIKEENGVLQLYWDKKYSNIDKYYIYKCVDGNAPKLIKTISGKERVFKDKSIQKGKTYKYIVFPVADIPARSVSTDEIIY